MRRLQKIVEIFMLLFFIQLAVPMTVHAADGILTIAVSSVEVSVGNSVSVTLRAEGPNGEGASADMEFTYDTSTFSFVSCDSQNYSGGEGGTVRASGSTVQITLKAIAPGESRIRVNGSNGFLTASQEALANMAAAGVVMQTSGQSDTGSKSADNSLSSLSLSVGALSPEFTNSVTEYTAEVPYETTDVTVDAKTSSSKAEIEAIQGATGLQVGENTIAITIKAEDGTRAVYRIVVTRKDAASQGQDTEGNTPSTTSPGQDTEGNVPGTTPSNEVGTQTNSTDNIQKEEYEQQILSLQTKYNEMREKYKEEKQFARRVIAILSFILVVLVIVCINLILFYKRKQKAGEEWGKEDKNKINNIRESEWDTEWESEPETVQEEEKWPDEEEVLSSPLPKKAAKNKMAVESKESREKDQKRDMKKDTEKDIEKDIEIIDLDKL